jgi:uncharacterized membrane protein YqjE
MTQMTTSIERPDLKEASTGELVRRLSEQLGGLLRGELELAKAELQTKGKRVGVGAGLAGAAGVLALFGLAAFITAAIAALALVWPVWLSAVVVGAALLVIAGLLALIGRSQIKQGAPPVPQQAIKGIKQDVEAVKEGIRR